MHYNNNHPISYKKRPTKWGLIKHDVAKLCGSYQIVVALNESGTFSEDTYRKLFNFSSQSIQNRMPLFSYIVS
jgi:hypothetical protein